MSNGHDFTKGAALTAGGEAAIRERYDARETPALLAELERQQAAAVDFVNDTRTLRFDAAPGRPPVLMAKDENDRWFADLGALGITQHAHQQVAEKLSIPRKHYDRLLGAHPDLLAQEVNTLWEREPKRVMVRTLDGSARAFLSDRFQRIDHLDVLRVVLPVLSAPGSEWQLHEFGLTEHKLHLRAIIPTMEAQIRVGDVVQLGITVSNSEVGDGALSVLPSIMRVVCSNLAVVNQAGLRRVHVGRQQDDFYQLLSEDTRKLDDLAFLSKVRDVVMRLADREQFMQLVGRIREHADLRLEDPVTASEVLAKKAGLSQEEHRLMLGNLTEGGDATYWGAVNALTRTARLLPRYDRRVAVETAAGGLLTAGREEVMDIVQARAA